MKKLLPFVALLLGFLSLSAPSRAQWIVKQGATYTITLPDIVASADHIAGLTGQTGTVYLARTAGATGTVTKAASTNSISEVDSTNAPGQYNLTLTSTETGTLGFIKGYYKSTNSDPIGFTVKIVAFDPDDATALGLSRIDATVSSRSTYAGADTSGTTTILSRLTSGRASALDLLDVAVSTRGTSTYAGADTAGTTTLLARLTSPRATLLDNLSNLDAAVSTRLATSGYTAPSTPPTASENAVAVWASGTRALTDKAGFSLAQAFPTNFSLLSVNSSGAITTSNPSSGGSSLSITDVQTALTNQGVTTTRAAYLDNIATAAPTAAAITTAVKAGTTPSWYTTPPTTSQIAAAVAAIVVDSTGSSSVTLVQAQALVQAALTGKYTVGTLNTTNRTQVTTYYKADGATVICRATVTFAANNTTVTGRTTVWSNLP